MLKTSLKIMSALAILTYGASSMAQNYKVIYGEDTRIDPAFEKNLLWSDLARSTVAQVSNDNLTFQDGMVTFKDVSLQELFNVCPTERFAEQNANAHCSAFLVAEDLIVTAGHCIDHRACEDNSFSWVFDYRIDELDGLTLPESRAYGCAEVLIHELDPFIHSDYALVRLDRPVLDREPLQFRDSGKVLSGQELIVIGHPSGLPTKIASGSTVHQNSHEEYFVADLDTYGGNSGSAVLDAQTGLVEGILVRGARDYVWNSQDSCFESNVCDRLGSNFTCGGESVSRITQLDILSFL